jgi:hypothetical protein
MTEWYRRKTWTQIDAEEFFAKLGRARKDGQVTKLNTQQLLEDHGIHVIPGLLAEIFMT